MVQIATEPSILLACVSFGIFSSMVPQLIVSKVCHSYYNNATTCKELSTGNYELEEKRVYDLAAKWNTACFAAISVPSLFTSLVVGALSGVLSKRKLLLLPPILLTIQAVILILCAKFISSSMVFVVLASGLTSIYGDFQGYSILLYSYMADVTRADQSRTVRMSALGGISFLGLGLGSFVAGILLERYSFISIDIESLHAICPHRRECDTRAVSQTHTTSHVPRPNRRVRAVPAMHQWHRSHHTCYHLLEALQAIRPRRHHCWPDQRHFHISGNRPNER